MKKLLCLILSLALTLSGCMLRTDVTALSGDALVVALTLLTHDTGALSPELEAAGAVACLEMEVMNGGLCQFFANCPDCAAKLPDALEAVGATEHKALYEQFLADTGIDPMAPMFRTEDVEEFSRLYDLYPWEDFDDAYCALTPIPELLESYIQANPDAF